MKPFQDSSKKKPEAIIQQAIIRELRYRGWFVKSTIGNAYQSGFPDLYCAHPRYGQRWVECKNPKAYRFTNMQMETFPQFAAHGVGIWVLVSADQDELDKLMKPPNWQLYIKNLGWHGK